MLQTNDLVLLLTDLENQGIEKSSQYLRVLLTNNSQKALVDTMKFINENRPFDIAQFYERMRKNHNEKKSPLYKNIVKDVDDMDEIITTLHAYILQVNLYSKHVDDKTMFFKHARAEEVTRVLNNYYKDYDITSALKMIKLIKADLLTFEHIIGRR